MTDFEKILSLILEKNPTRLIVKPTTKTLIAGFGIKKIIKLSDYNNYLEFKENVKKELSSRGIGFGSLFFDIDKNIKSNLWKDFEQAEFTFTNSSRFIFIEFLSDRFLFLNVYGKSKCKLFESSK